MQTFAAQHKLQAARSLTGRWQPADALWEEELESMTALEWLDNDAGF